MNTDTKTTLQPAASASIIFNGHTSMLDQHRDVVKEIMRVLATDPYENISIYMNPVDGTENLEWSAVITSPRGRRHLAITQRTPGGSILFKTA
jgi:hypothetical protein